MHLLDKCDYEYSKSQFGFIPGRGTDIANCLAHDVASYCWSPGSATFLCSLDAAGAFDSIPHPVIFHKTMDVLPDNEWMLLVYWYLKLKVCIK